MARLQNFRTTFNIPIPTIDAKTLQIRAVQLTTNNVSDSRILGELLDQILLDEQIDSVYTDEAYNTKQCRQVIADR